MLYLISATLEKHNVIGPTDDPISQGERIQFAGRRREVVDREIVEIHDDVFNGLIAGRIQADIGEDREVLALAEMGIEVQASRNRGIRRDHIEQGLDLLFACAGRAIRPEGVESSQRRVAARTEATSSSCTLLTART